MSAESAVFEVELQGESEQLAFGGELARALQSALSPPHGLVYLRGELGAGKTTLVRGLLRALGYLGAVRSPTYTLIEPYEAIDPPVVHLDLYRLGDPEELDDLGLRDLVAAPSLLLVEWPERGFGVLPAADLEIDIRPTPAGRSLVLRAVAHWTPVLDALRSHST